MAPVKHLRLAAGIPAADPARPCRKPVSLFRVIG
jgi:hypothetical protein